MDDLSAWLLEQISDDEREEEHLDSGWWEVDSDHSETYGAIMRFAGKDRVLAECEAKRKLLALHQHGRLTGPLASITKIPFTCISCGGVGWCEHVRLLTLPYADQPGYREEWKP